MRSRTAIYLAATLLTGCATTSAPAPKTPQSTRKPAVRLAHIVWQVNTTVTLCTRRIDDDNNTIGNAGPCYKSEVANPPLQKIISWMGAGPSDKRSPDHHPEPRCHFEAEDAKLVPPEVPAKLFLVSPSGRTEIFNWPPPPGATADAYRLETSLSPDGATLAIIRLQLGLGEAQRIVEPEGIDFITPARCK